MQATITLNATGATTLPAPTNTSTVAVLSVNEGGCIATISGNATITVETCVIPIFTWSFIDPCNCENPNNITLADGTFLVADFIRVDASQYTNPTVRLITADANFLDNTGIPIEVATASFTDQGGGIFELPYYTLPDAPTSFVVDVNGDQQAGTSTTCSPCTLNIIPTLTQWGFLIYGLLILNLFVVFLYRKEKEIVID